MQIFEKLTEIMKSMCLFTLKVCQLPEFFIQNALKFNDDTDCLTENKLNQKC